eukprot:360936-Chlamydomonas_euryale.AAC.3
MAAAAAVAAEAAAAVAAGLCAAAAAADGAAAAASACLSPLVALPAAGLCASEAAPPAAATCHRQCSTSPLWPCRLSGRRRWTQPPNFSSGMFKVAQSRLHAHRARSLELAGWGKIGTTVTVTNCETEATEDQTSRTEEQTFTSVGRNNGVGGDQREPGKGLRVTQATGRGIYHPPCATQPWTSDVGGFEAYSVGARPSDRIVWAAGSGRRYSIGSGFNAVWVVNTTRFASNPCLETQLASDPAQPHHSAALSTAFLALMRPRASQKIVHARALSLAD